MWVTCGRLGYLIPNIRGFDIFMALIPAFDEFSSENQPCSSSRRIVVLMCFADLPVISFSSSVLMIEKYSPSKLFVALSLTWKATARVTPFRHWNSRNDGSRLVRWRSVVDMWATCR